MGPGLGEAHEPACRRRTFTSALQGLRRLTCMSPKYTYERRSERLTE